MFAFFKQQEENHITLYFKFDIKTHAKCKMNKSVS